MVQKNYFLELKDSAEVIENLGNKFEVISGNLGVSEKDFFETVELYDKEIQTARISVRKFSTAKPPSVLAEDHTKLIYLLNEYLKNTQDAVNSLKEKEHEQVIVNIKKQKETTIAISEHCKHCLSKI